MKLSKLVDPQFQAALRRLTAQDLPLKTAFALKGIIKNINEELTKYDEVRNDALNRLGSKKEDGSVSKNEQGNVDLSEENMNLFLKELNVLINTDVIVGSVKVASLGDKVQMTTNDILSLDDLLE